MVLHPEYHLRGEIRKILRFAPGATEVLIRIRGKHYDPERPETYLHVRAVDVHNRAHVIGVGGDARVLLLLKARFVEETERRHRTFRVDARPRGNGPAAPIRVLGHDSRVAGKVVRVLDSETIVLDAGIPLLVKVPQPTGLPAVDDHVEFLLQEPALVELL